MNKKIFKNELEELIIRTLNIGSNDINVLKEKLICISPITFAKTIQELYFKRIITIKNDSIYISAEMKTLCNYLFENRIRKYEVTDLKFKYRIVNRINETYGIDVINEITVLFI